jgi:hypothetical protein
MMTNIVPGLTIFNSSVCHVFVSWHFDTGVRVCEQHCEMHQGCLYATFK